MEWDFFASAVSRAYFVKCIVFSFKSIFSEVFCDLFLVFSFFSKVKTGERRLSPLASSFSIWKMTHSLSVFVWDVLRLCLELRFGFSRPKESF